MDATFRQRQRELCLISSFITEQEQWLNDWLTALGWTLDSLNPDNQSELLKCPFNPNHYLPSSSMEEHKKKCQCASFMGTSIHSLADDELTLHSTDSSFLYKDSSVESIQIGRCVKDAVKKLAAHMPEGEQVSRPHDYVKELFSSLEEIQPSPEEIRCQKPPQLISYIKSWKLVPNDFAQLDASSLNLVKVKGWLFKNLPEKHPYSSSLGGEITMVDSIMACLSPPASFNRVKKIAIAPNMVMNRLQPLLGLDARSLVLDLWKFLHISRLQKEYGISDSFVNDIAAMAPSIVKGMRAESKGEEDVPLPSISELITEMMKDDVSPDDTPSLLPPDHVTWHFSTSERRILYDYIVEVTSYQAFMKLEPDLYRDDMALMKAKLKVLGKMDAVKSNLEANERDEFDTKGKTYLQLLKERRDYKRRRQKYRAKNVHITRRTPTEIFRTIINNRMEELKATNDDNGGGDVDKDLPSNKPEDAGDDAKFSEEKEKRRYRSGSREQDHRKLKRYQSRSQSREKRERRGHRKKHRSKDRDRRSKSREKNQKRVHKHKRHRSRSKS